MLHFIFCLLSLNTPSCLSFLIILSSFLYFVFVLSLFHRRIKQIVSFSSLLHTSVQNISFHSLFLTVLLSPCLYASFAFSMLHLRVSPTTYYPSMPPFPSISVKSLYSYCSSTNLLLYCSSPLQLSFFFFKLLNIMTWFSLRVRWKEKGREKDVDSFTVKVICKGPHERQLNNSTVTHHPESERGDGKGAF